MLLVRVRLLVSLVPGLRTNYVTCVENVDGSSASCGCSFGDDDGKNHEYYEHLSKLSRPLAPYIDCSRTGLSNR